jgi:hypothetical protein
MHLGNRGVVRVAHVRLAVGEEVVDDHSDDGEEEDNETPENLVRHGAVRLENLDCTFVSTIKNIREIWKYVLQTRISRTKTMKPIIPPPVP